MINQKRLLAYVLTVLAMMSLLVVPAFAEGEEAVEVTSNFYMTFWSLLPPIIAIALVLLIS